MSSEQPQPQQKDPKAIMRYIFLGALFVTWVFWNVAAFHCSFLKVGPDSSHFDYKDEPDFGLFSYAEYDGGRIYTCSRYHPDADFNGAHNAARFFGAFGYIVHTLAFFIAVTTVMFVRVKVPLIWLIVRILVVVSLVCSLLIFSAFGSDLCDGDGDFNFGNVKCVPGAGGIIAIFNIVFIIGTLVLSWLVAPPQNPLFMLRSWQEEDSTAAQPAPTTVTGRVVQKEDSSAEPTQTMNDEYNLEQPTPVGPPTMSYIQNETTNKQASGGEEAEA